MPRHTLVPTPLDGVRTVTSCSQVSTEANISSFLLSWLDSDDDQNPQEYQPIDSVLLARPSHISFIYSHFSHLPREYMNLDACRSWVMLWIVGSLSWLGVKIKEEERLKSIETLLSFQHPQGGFAGGPDQSAHVASSFVAICTLATLLDGADQTLVDQTWARIDLKKMYSWLLSLKFSDGSFAIQSGSEIDVRACYCVISLATLLNLLTPDLVRNVTDYLTSCQTHEGGMSATSFFTPHAQAAGATLPTLRKAVPIGEAHGGYTFCALAAYFLLQGLPSTSDSPKLNYQSCLHWAAHMQGLPIEGGGFRGRTNKLVDGCYNWWCGGLFSILQALLFPNSSEQQQSTDLFDRQAAQEYILLVSQDLTPNANKGGLRDKPTLSPDFYHTYHILAGLAAAQHFPTHTPQRINDVKDKFKTPDFYKCVLGDTETHSEANERMKEIYSRALGWQFEKEKELVVGLISNQIDPVHPALNIKPTAVENVMKYFYQQNQN